MEEGGYTQLCQGGTEGALFVFLHDTLGGRDPESLCAASVFSEKDSHLRFSDESHTQWHLELGGPGGIDETWHRHLSLQHLGFSRFKVQSSLVAQQ